MTISIPAAVTLLSSNVVDTTQAFNPNEHLLSYPAGVKYQHNNKIYQNTGDSIEIKDYNVNDEAGYTGGQILYKDGANVAHWYIDGQFVKQPDAYTETQNTGLDASTWTTRYSKFADIPVDYIDENWDADLFLNWTEKNVLMSPDGSKMVQVSNDWVESFNLSDPYNPTSGGAENGYFGTPWTTTQNGTINDAGTKLLLMRSSWSTSFYNEIRSYNLSTAWNAGTSTQTGAKNMEGFGSWVLGMRIMDAVFNDTATVLFVFWQDTNNNYRTLIQKFTLSTAGDIDTATYNSEQYFDKIYALNTTSLHSVIYNVRVSNSGNEIIITAGRNDFYFAYVFTLATAYDIMSTKTLASMHVQEDYILSGVFFTADRTKAYFQQTDSWDYTTYRMYLPEPGNIGLTLWSKNRYEANRVVNNETQLYRYVFEYDTDLDIWTSTTQVYDLTTGELVYNQSSTDTTYYTILDNNSIEKDAVYPVSATYDALMLKTFIRKDSSIFVRTHVARYAEFETLQYHAYLPIESPTDIPQFTLIGANNTYSPLDSKNYSSAISSGTTMTYTVTCNESGFDTLALGNVKADSVNAVFKQPDGITITTDITRSIDRSIDDLGVIDGATTTVILYATEVMPVGSTAEITLTISSGNVELGTLMLGQSIDAGFHNLALRHTYKDFSVADYDVWGNLDYIERQRIQSYNGQVDIPVTSYDRVLRLFTFLGKKLVIVNGSKSKTAVPDSQTVFASTQKIGRFMSFNQQTIIKDEEMDRDASYSFTLEELA